MEKFKNALTPGLCRERQEVSELIRSIKLLTAETAARNEKIRFLLEETRQLNRNITKLEEDILESIGGNQAK